jgi:hypothetical protein
MSIADDLGAALTENAHPGHMKAYSDKPAGHNTSVGRTRARLFHEALFMSTMFLEAHKAAKMQVARMHESMLSNDLSFRLRY